jgi:uncharacterized protein (TIGR00255 family)
MILSMTGFGKTQINLQSGVYEVYIKTLNSKNADINIRLSNSLREREIEIRQILIEQLNRGKIDAFIVHNASVNDAQAEIVTEKAKHYYNQLKQLKSVLGIDEPQDYLSILLKFPDLIQTQNQSISDEEWSQIKEAILNTINEVSKWRKQEGDAIYNELNKYIHNIQNIISNIEKLLDNRREELHAKIIQNISSFVQNINLDANRLEQEVLYYLERSDVSEEISRAKNHCSFFVETMNNPISNGKKLIFISQEIHRELNTLGVKINDIDIQKYVVNMKDDIEKIKEQLYNVL